jgi:hypothetical protein
VTTKLPPLGETRNAYTVVAMCLDKHLALVRHEDSSGGSTEQAKSLIGGLAEGLRAAYDQLQAADRQETTSDGDG